MAIIDQTIIADSGGTQLDITAANAAKVDGSAVIQPTSVADGSNINQGSNADAAVVTDTGGTLSGKLRGLVKWAFERMPTSLGQKTMANSLPVVIASDQTIGGGTQYTEDTILPAHPTGNQLMARRQDTLTKREVSATGDAIALNATDQGALLIAMTDMTMMLKRALQSMERPPYMTPVGRVRIDYTDAQAAAAMSVTIASGTVTTVTTVTTVSSITALNNMGAAGIDQSFGYYSNNRDLFNNYKQNIIN